MGRRKKMRDKIVCLFVMIWIYDNQDMATTNNLSGFYTNTVHPDEFLYEILQIPWKFNTVQQIKIDLCFQNNCHVYQFLHKKRHTEDDRNCASKS